jgi:glycine cleavage system H lipoate-binding protein
MDAILETLTAVGIFVVGLVARLGLVFAVMAVLVVPVLLLAGGAKAVKAARLWFQGYRAAGGLRFRNGLLYAPGHTWVKDGGRSLRVGLDDLAQTLVPWSVGVTLPEPGTVVKAGEVVARISCGHREIGVAAPVSGRVSMVNTAVMREPTLAKSDSYGSGWLFDVEPADAGWRTLPGGEAARSWLAAEGARLGRFYEHQLGMAAADGGEIIGSPEDHLTDAQWRALAREFLRT